MAEPQTPPLQWEELTEEQRIELLNVAKSRIFWKQFFARLTWLKGLATVLLTLAAAWTLFSEAIAAWLSKL